MTISRARLALPPIHPILPSGDAPGFAKKRKKGKISSDKR